jgi:hypothetical protein
MKHLATTPSSGVPDRKCESTHRSLPALLRSSMISTDGAYTFHSAKRSCRKLGKEERDRLNKEIRVWEQPSRDS